MKLTARLVATVLALTSCAGAEAAGLGGGEPLDVSLGRIVAALVVSIIVAGLAVMLVRQRGGKVDLGAWFSRLEVRPRAIRVVETRRLSPHADICLVRHGDAEFLLVLSAGRAQVLRERPAPDDAGIAA